jgi:hypothetical protein
MSFCSLLNISTFLTCLEFLLYHSVRKRIRKDQKMLRVGIRVITFARKNVFMVAATLGACCYSTKFLCLIINVGVFPEPSSY